MTTHDFDRTAELWLEDGPTTLSDRALQAALDEIHVTRQRRAWWPARRFSPMGNTIRLVAAVAVILVIAFVGINLVAPGNGGVGGPAATSTPTPTLAPTPTPSPTPSPTPDPTTGWVGLSSGRYGYDLAYPPTWSASPATRDWSLDLDVGQMVNPGVDHFIGGPDGNQISLTAFSARVPAGTSNDDWLAAWLARSPSCLRTDLWEAITVDGQPARLDPDACDAAQAYVFIGDRAFVFSVARPDQVALLKAFLSTVRFHPDVLPSASPSSSP